MSLQELNEGNVFDMLYLMIIKDEMYIQNACLKFLVAIALETSNHIYIIKEHSQNISNNVQSKRAFLISEFVNQLLQ